MSSEKTAIDIGQDILEAINAIKTNIEVREGKKDPKEAIDPKQSGMFDGLKNSGMGGFGGGDVLKDIFGEDGMGGL